MSDFIVNPRRAPRAPTRCRARVQASGSTWDAETEDVGPHGCQLVAPAPLARGAAIMVALAGPGVKEQLTVRAKVAWVSSQAPWRLGVSFDEASRPGSTRWFELLVAARPGLGNFRRVPDRLPVDAMVFLSAPPRFADFTDEEVEIIRHVAGGTTIAALRARLKEAWSTLQRALFSLLSRGVVTVARGAAVHPEAWRAVMAGLGAQFVIEQLPPREAPAFGAMTPPPAWREAPPPTALEPIDLPPLEEPPPPPAPRPVPPQATPPATAAAAAPPLPGQASAGTGWRGAGRGRSADAQEAYELGLQELEAGRIKAAMALLRRAIQLAPGDAEVAAALGRAMKG